MAGCPILTTFFVVRVGDHDNQPAIDQEKIVRIPEGCRENSPG